MRYPIVLFAILLPLQSWGQTTSYHIGNSLTWDSQPLAMELFGDEFDSPHQSGYHIRNGWSLKSFINDPNEVTIEPVAEFGKYSEALSNFQWDAVTLQPHGAQGSTLQDDVDSILSFIESTRSNPANTNTTFYIYEAWPDRLGGTYESRWTASLPVEEDPPTEAYREYFDELYERITQETDARIRTIPVGEVIYELDISIGKGLIPGFTSIPQIYRDPLHLDDELGRYLASATTFATLSGTDPSTLYKPPGFHLAHFFPIAQEVYDPVNKIIRDVLSADPHSGVYFPNTDFDGNGIVGSKDLRLWENSYPGLQYDLDKDEMVTGLDFLRWQLGTTTMLPVFDDSPANLDGLGLVDSADLAIWHQAYGVSSDADLDGDGDTDGLDFLQLQVELTPFHPADVNRDRKIDGGDLNLWTASYGYNGVVDADGDGMATGLDFLLWQQESGLRSNPVIPNVSLVPEPTLLLQVTTLITLLSFRGGTRGLQVSYR